MIIRVSICDPRVLLILRILLPKVSVYVTLFDVVEVGRDVQTTRTCVTSERLLKMSFFGELSYKEFT